MDKREKEKKSQLLNFEKCGILKRFLRIFSTFWSLRIFLENSRLFKLWFKNISSRPLGIALPLPTQSFNRYFILIHQMGNLTGGYKIDIPVLQQVWVSNRYILVFPTGHLKLSISLTVLNLGKNSFIVSSCHCYNNRLSWSSVAEMLIMAKLKIIIHEHVTQWSGKLQRNEFRAHFSLS